MRIGGLNIKLFYSLTPTLKMTQLTYFKLLFKIVLHLKKNFDWKKPVLSKLKLLNFWYFTTIPCISVANLYSNTTISVNQVTQYPVMQRSCSTRPLRIRYDLPFYTATFLNLSLSFGFGTSACCMACKFAATLLSVPGDKVLPTKQPNQSSIHSYVFAIVSRNLFGVY